jgi:hypothetical protein
MSYRNLFLKNLAVTIPYRTVCTNSVPVNNNIYEMFQNINTVPVPGTVPTRTLFALIYWYMQSVHF